MKPAILFDLGNTLAAYYRKEQFRPILEAAITAVSGSLASRGLAHVSFDSALARAIEENREAADFRVTPLVARLERIFDTSLSGDVALSEQLCRDFLGPIFALGRVYDDATSVIQELRSRGHPVAIVSNTPWGSPPDLWRGELSRLGLASVVDSMVFCGDTGWRKPAPEIFRFAAAAVDRAPEECIFVGDDLRWDISGSEAVGMRPVLLDRDRRHRQHPGERIEALAELLRVGVRSMTFRRRADTL